MLGRPLGYIVSLNYKRSSSFYEDGFTGQYEPPSGGTLPPALLLSDTKGSEEAHVGSVVNLNYRLTPNNTIGTNLIYSHVGESLARFQSGPWPRENTFRFDNRTLSWSERQVYSLLAFTGDAEAYFADGNVGVTQRDDNGTIRGFGHYVQDRTRSTNNYNGDRTIAAAYAMVELPIVERFNVIGQRITTLVSGEQTAGSKEVVFDTSDLSSGVYMVRLRAAGSTLTQKMTVVK